MSYLSSINSILLPHLLNGLGQSIKGVDKKLQCYFKAYCFYSSEKYSLILKRAIKMNILASALFQKRQKNIYLRLESCVVWVYFLAFKYIFFHLFVTSLRLFIFVHKYSLKPALETWVSVHYNHMHLCGQLKQILKRFCIVEKTSIYR